MATASQELEQSAEHANRAVETVAESASAGVETLNSKLIEDREELFANADVRRDLRRKVEKRELRLAFRDLAEGVRGLIRVTPFTAVLAGAIVGAALARRPKPKRPQARRG